MWLVQIVLIILHTALQQSRMDVARHSLQNVFLFALVIAACAAEVHANTAATNNLSQSRSRMNPLNFTL